LEVDKVKSRNLEDWTLEEVLEGVGETFDGMLTQKYTKNEPLYPVIRNALRWLVMSYLEGEEEDEILQKENRREELPSNGTDEGARGRSPRS
jgi:hypothetical protein